MQIQEDRDRWFELVVLFIVTPVVLAMAVPNIVKFIMVALSIVYVSYQIWETKIYSGVFSYEKPSKSFVSRLIIIGVSILGFGALAVYNYDSSLLFSIVKEKPLLWVFILFVYTFLSVVPQEIVYRHFFFDRYALLFSNKTVFILVNMFCFSLCHLFLWNDLVLLLTFVGGGLFAYTFQQEKSMIWVCAEHALYGFIIFTLGVGEMLAFPT